MTKPAVFSVFRVTPGCVVLRDDFTAENPTLTITNNAEYVVKQMVAAYPGRRIFYYDTENEIAELVHKNGEFTGFTEFNKIPPL